MKIYKEKGNVSNTGVDGNTYLNKHTYTKSSIASNLKSDVKACEELSYNDTSSCI